MGFPGSVFVEEIDLVYQIWKSKLQYKKNILKKYETNLKNEWDIHIIKTY